jgi:lysozyme
MWRVTSARGREMIEQFEGRRNRAYKCSAGVWTCGIGCTGPDVGPDTVWTDEEVEEHFTAALRRFEIGVNRLVTVALSQNQFDALVSFSYNCGLMTLANSTLLKLLNRGAFREASLQFERFCHAGGQVLPGLSRRRRAEMALFVSRD